MQLIEQYIFRRIAVMTLSTLVVVTTIVLTTQLLNRVNMATRSVDSFLAFASIALHLVPSMVMVVIPFALLVGVMRTLNAMNSDSELAVLESAGRSPASTARPAILLGIILTIVSLFIAHVAEPWANRNVREAIARAGADLIRSAAQAGTFQPIQAGTYLQIAEQLPGGGFGRIILADTRDPRTQLIYHAKQASLIEREGAAIFVMVDGQVHRRNLADSSVSVISFASTALDFGQFMGSGSDGKDRPQEMSTAALFSPDVNNVAAKNAPAEIRREIHRRMTEWLYPLVFTLAALYFAGTARSSRQQRPLLAVAGGTLALVIRIGGFVAVSNSGSSTFFALVTYLLPIGAIAILSALILSDRKFALPAPLQSVVSGVSRRVAAATGAISSRLPRRRAQEGRA